MWGLPIFGRKKLLLAFEYGVILSQVAKDRGIEITPEMIQKAETMIENEARTRSTSKMATDMEPNILSIFELDLSK